MWGAGLLSTPLDELNTVFSPDGKEVYWSIALPQQNGGVIMTATLVNGKWTSPEIAPFSGQYTDWDPFFTPDGKKIIYVSNRPNGTERKGPPDFDLWVVNRTAGGGWSAPENLGAPVNTPRPEYYPSIASDGTLYFSSNHEGRPGAFDIYRSKLVDGKYTEPENLGPNVNAPGPDIDNYIAPDQSFIIFNSTGGRTTWDAATCTSALTRMGSGRRRSISRRPSTRRHASTARSGRRMASTCTSRVSAASRMARGRARSRRRS